MSFRMQKRTVEVCGFPVTALCLNITVEGLPSVTRQVAGDIKLRVDEDFSCGRPDSLVCYTAVFQSFIVEKPSSPRKRAAHSSDTNA